MASCKRESRLTSLGRAPAMGPHLACEWPGRQRANLRVEVSAQPHQPYYYAMYAQTLAEQSQRSIGARVELKCLCVFDLSCPGRHPHASSTSYLAAGPQRLNGRSKR